MSVEVQPSLSPGEGVGPPRAGGLVRNGKRLLLLLWLASLALPAASNYDGSPGWNDASGPIYGLEILLFGWTDLGWGPVAWLANPLFLVFLGVRLDGAEHRGRSLTLALLFVVAFTSALLWRTGYGPDGWVQTPGGPGYVLWFIPIGAATLWAASAAVLGYRVQR